MPVQDFSSGGGAFFLRGLQKKMKIKLQEFDFFEELTNLLFFSTTAYSWFMFGGNIFFSSAGLTKNNTLKRHQQFVYMHFRHDFTSQIIFGGGMGVKLGNPPGFGPGLGQ